MRTIASVGEIVTCEQGHEICDVVQPIMTNQALSKTVFGNWRPNCEAGEGALIPPCPVCRSLWIDFTMYGPSRLHVGTEWRS